MHSMNSSFNVHYNIKINLKHLKIQLKKGACFIFPFSTNSTKIPETIHNNFSGTRLNTELTD